MGLERKTEIEAILKRLQGIDTKLRYQVRLGKNDLTVMVKHHQQYDYQAYVPVSLDIIDPNNVVPNWDLNTNANNQNPAAENFKGTKRIAEGSPEGSIARKKKHEDNIYDWQVAEFLSAFIDGTVTAPNYSAAL